MRGRTVRPSKAVAPEQNLRRDTETGQVLVGGTEGIPDTDRLVENARGNPEFMDDGTFVHERHTYADTGHLTQTDRERFGLSDEEDHKWKFSDEYCKEIGRWNNSVRNALRTSSKTHIRLVTVDGEPVRDGDMVLMAQPRYVDDARDRVIAEQRMDLRRRLKASGRERHDVDNPSDEEAAETAAKRREIEELQAQLSPTRGKSLEAGMRYEMERRGCKTMREVVNQVAQEELAKRLGGLDLSKFELPKRETKGERKTFIMGR